MTERGGPVTELEWHSWPWQRRCQRTGGDGIDWGRCELRREHAGDHALERGMYVLRFGPLRIWCDSPAGPSTVIPNTAR